MVIKVEKSGECSKAHPTTKFYIYLLEKRVFENLKELEKELGNNADFRYPTLNEVMGGGGSPFLGHIPATEVSAFMKEHEEQFRELLKKYNPSPLPILYLQRTQGKVVVDRLPYSITELPIIERVELAAEAVVRGSGFYEEKVVAVAKSVTE
jgi:hypothetical protein